MSQTANVKSAAPESCFHCGLEVPPDAVYPVSIEGAEQPMCCPGCQAVAQAIVEHGLVDYYRHRTAPAPTGQGLVPDELRNARVFDLPEVQASFVESDPAGHQSASLILEGITCAACIWLNERHLRQLPGVISADINFATQRAQVVWDPAQIKLSGIIEGIQAIGYNAHPYDPGMRQQLLEQERKGLIRRVGVAAALGMQVMILSVGLYAGDFFGMESVHEELFRRLALLLTLPILFYSAQPFFSGAWRDLRHGRVGMDLPVSLGMGIAFGASTWATLRGSGEVYFDSVAMFAFFLLGARLLEMGARRRAAVAADNLAQAVPQGANRLDESGTTTLIAALDLEPGDRILVRPGETIPADGVIRAGDSAIDESMLSGESRPVTKAVGDDVLCGSINREQALTVEVTRVARDTVLSGIQRLYERGQQQKPRISRIADRVAAWFVLVVLTVAAGTAIYWWRQDSAHWLEITVSVLVVACPCALSLATPAALSAAVGGLVSRGVLITRGVALEGFATATDIAFDKTGTLTTGELRVVGVEPVAGQTEVEVLALATALEIASEHPIARAFRLRLGQGAVRPASDVKVTPGRGIRGVVNGRTYTLGSAAYVRAGLAGVDWPWQDAAVSETEIVLADETAVLARFLLADDLRDDAESAVGALRAAGIDVHLVSGDRQAAVSGMADRLGMDAWHAEQMPDQKMALIQSWQASGRRVAMIGDGINDAPVLAGADVSVAVSGASPMAMENADIALLTNRLASIPLLHHQARRTMVVIRQNLTWAASYNFCALPFAALGWVPPWLAAIGMSLSSLLVVGNALRLTRLPGD